MFKHRIQVTPQNRMYSLYLCRLVTARVNFWISSWYTEAEFGVSCAPLRRFLFAPLDEFVVWLFHVFDGGVVVYAHGAHVALHLLLRGAETIGILLLLLHHVLRGDQGRRWHGGNLGDPRRRHELVHVHAAVHINRQHRTDQILRRLGNVLPIIRRKRICPLNYA